MSVTIESDISRQTTNQEESCMCAQSSKYWLDFQKGADTPAIRADLQQEADPNCPYCKGSGIEVVAQDVDFPSLNLSNENAKVLFTILGLNINSSDGMVGEMSISEARRAIIRAQSRKSLEKFVRPEEKTFGKPREISPGVIDMKPLRFFHFGLPLEKLQRYIKTFAEFVIEVSRRGATKIFWS